MDKLDVVKELGGIAEETLTAIKVVTSFGREQRELEKFSEYSVKTRQVAMK
jgi:ABC-type multidrug transport system fused ATPase/permease subunit